MDKEELKRLKKEFLKATKELKTTSYLIKLGVIIGATDPECKQQSSKGREMLIQDLEGSKAKIQSCLKQYEQLIDEAIQSLS